MILVVASNRPDSLRRFLESWSPMPFSDFVLVFPANGDELKDLERQIGPICQRHAPNTKLHILSTDRIRDLGEDGECISVGDPGVKMFGLWYALRVLNGASAVILDDDCYPLEGVSTMYFVDGHEKNLFSYDRYSSSVPGVRVRGEPYYHHGTFDSDYVAASMGLWNKVPDIDGIHALGHTKERQLSGSFSANTVATRMLHPRERVPICGMNYAIPRWSLPISYFPKMGHGSPYFRFDDIWGGWILQKLCQVLDRGVVVGRPLVNHDRASDAMTNMVREAPGIKANEVIARAIESQSLSGVDTPESAAELLGEYLQKYAGLEMNYSEVDTYIGNMGRYLQQWVRLSKRNSL